MHCFCPGSEAHHHVTRQVTAQLNPPMPVVVASAPSPAERIPPRPKIRDLANFKAWCAKYDPSRLERLREQQARYAREKRAKQAEKFKNGPVTKSMLAEKRAEREKAKYVFLVDFNHSLPFILY